MAGISLSRLWISPLVRLGLARSPRRVARAIRNFSATEAETAWQLLYAFERTSDAHERAELFTQIIEESSHAKIFANLYQSVSGEKMNALRVVRAPLHPAPADFWKLNVYFKIGEEKAVKRFEDISNGLSEGPLKLAVDRILADEAKHVSQATDLVQIKGPSPSEVARLTRKIQLSRIKEAWLRLGRSMVQMMGALILNVTYFSMAPVALLLKRRSK